MTKILTESAVRKVFQELGNAFDSHRKKIQKLRIETADGFSVFDFIDPSENVLSDILAFLLNPDASHGQGPLFLQELLLRACPGKTPEIEYATVARESRTYAIEKHRRRIDILVTMPEFVFAIYSPAS